MSNRLYILLNAFLIKVFLFYNMVFTRFYYKGLLLGVVLVDAREYKLPSLNICLPCDIYILGGFSRCFSGFFQLVFVFLGRVQQELQLLKCLINNCIFWSSCYTQPKKTKNNQKNPEKHLENPPKIYISQGRHILNDGGSHSRASTRTTSSNSPL